MWTEIAHVVVVQWHVLVVRLAGYEFKGTTLFEHVNAYVSFFEIN